MISLTNQGAIEATTSGIFASKTKVLWKLAFGSESVDIVERFYHRIINTAPFAAEKTFGYLCQAFGMKSKGSFT